MAENMRKSHDAAFKARVALEAIRGEKTMAQISSEYGVHTNQLRQWRQKLDCQFFVMNHYEIDKGQKNSKRDDQILKTPLIDGWQRR